MKIAIASDHAGFDLKSLIIKEFGSKFQIIDLGCDNSEISVDYPDFAKKLAQEIISKSVDFGILVCGSGIGISIAANRFKQIRAALCHNSQTAELSRKHNDANVLCLGARIVNEKDAIKIVETFLNTDFEGARHARRVEKLS
ncbi:MAG: ribose 5-phosphate isomerase B [Rickettsiales bacterium]|jgi:ribose 5-phosphate isomerase B